MSDTEQNVALEEGEGNETNNPQNKAINALLLTNDDKFIPRLLFQHNNLCPPLESPDMKYVSIKEIVSSTEAQEGSYIIGCLFRVVHGKRDVPAQLSQYMQNRQRLAQRRMIEKNYSRMFFFTDPSAPQTCFVLFESTDYPEKSLWGNCVMNRSQLGIGNFFMIMEPESEYITRSGLMVITTKWPIIPIQTPALTTSYIPPATALKIESFFINPANIQFSMATVNDSKCGGTFCDRQDPFIDKCACYATNRKRNFVISFKIHAQSNTQGVDLHGELTSWKASQLVFKNGENGLERQDPDKLKQNIFLLRKAFKQLAAVINGTTEKWTVMGWQRLGEVGDDNAISETSKIHIVTLTPNNHEAYQQFLNSTAALDNTFN